MTIYDGSVIEVISPDPRGPISEDVVGRSFTAPDPSASG